MPSALEHIKEEIKALRPAERYDLWSELSREFDPVESSEEDEEAVEAAWDIEIDARVREVQEGKVDLIPVDEAIERIRTKLAEQRKLRSSGQ
ncbi:addiction module protein [Roseimicrobium sp. ORNL1]|uniref:addiction module protein n=1 Tax=Roseimicrobium sp. ORNL1 TaxID=2711231 RepID=UPI0013E142C9|nr:addiction module protein [Roseimicrobium sp. ORNL1]QIF05522.1 hypothetical protein G5S37_29830 [Roseimicrobium sp. ORNL1]